jgi:septal ring factor EnvC (AmiA/AmiB activator)
MKPFRKEKTQDTRKRSATAAARRSSTSLAFILPCLAGSLWLAPGAAPAREKHAAAPTSAEVSEKKDDLKELRGQIEALRKGVVAAEGKRADTADQLQDIEREISVTQRDLHNLGTQRDKLQGTLKDLASQARELEERLGGQQQQLAKLVYRQYLQGTPDALRLLLNGEDPSQMARDLHYLAAIGRARGQLLGEIETTLQRKHALAADAQQRAEEMAAVEARQKEQRDKLVAQREQRKAVLERISAKIVEQRREIGNLQRDEKQLAQLIERLAKAAAAKAAAEKAAAEKAAAEKTAAAKAATQRQAARQPAARDLARQPAERAAPSKPAPVEMNNESTPQAVPDGSFVRLKGGLRLPTRGVVSNRFGGARQEGSTWKGLFIRASAGSEVKAIAGGKVVFADWMRGFGNLLIVDHGGSYLSIYGNNDALLKQVGDAVRGGDTIASVGNSGGNPESGLYFELRHQGQALDPLKWVSLK